MRVFLSFRRYSHGETYILVSLHVLPWEYLRIDRNRRIHYSKYTLSIVFKLGISMLYKEPTTFNFGSIVY